VNSNELLRVENPFKKEETLFKKGKEPLLFFFLKGLFFFLNFLNL